MIDAMAGYNLAGLYSVSLVLQNPCNILLEWKTGRSQLHNSLFEMIACRQMSRAFFQQSKSDFINLFGRHPFKKLPSNLVEDTLYLFTCCSGAKERLAKTILRKRHTVAGGFSDVNCFFRFHYRCKNFQHDWCRTGFQALRIQKSRQLSYRDNSAGYQITLISFFGNVLVSSFFGISTLRIPLLFIGFILKLFDIQIIVGRLGLNTCAQEFSFLSTRSVQLSVSIISSHVFPDFRNTCTPRS